MFAFMEKNSSDKAIIMSSESISHGSGMTILVVATKMPGWVWFGIFLIIFFCWQLPEQARAIELSDDIQDFGLHHKWLLIQLAGQRYQAYLRVRLISHRLLLTAPLHREYENRD